MPRFPLLESIATRLLSPVLGELRSELHASESHLSILREERDEAQIGLAEAQGGALGGGVAGREAGWVETNGLHQHGEPTRSELRLLIARSRAMYLRNPLIKRAINVQSFYVFGRGVSLTSTNTRANQVLADFQADSANQWLCESWGAAALDRELSICGNLFFSFFGDRATGRVVARIFDVDEITDVIRDPQDRFTPWFYERTFSTTDEQGRPSSTTELYPDWKHNPAKKPASLDDKPINWDVPVMHIKTGGLLGWKFGAPERWAGLDWARGYSSFLQDRATVAKALAQFTWKIASSVKRGVEGVRARLAATTRAESPVDGAGRGLGIGGGQNGAPSGNTAALGPSASLEATTVKGATIDPDEGRRLSLMVACDAGLSETFFGDASVGTLATAQSLDRPTELMFELRRSLWQHALEQIAFLVLSRAAFAVRNKFRATYGVQGFAPVLKDATGKPIPLDVDFPDLLEHDVDARTKAIDLAAKYLPGPGGKKQVARMMLAALGEDDVDQILDDCDFTQPEPSAPVPAPTPGQPATQPATQAAQNSAPPAATPGGSK